MAKLGKRTRASREAFAGKMNVSVEEAVALVKGNAKAKFDETIEIAMNLGVDTRHADQRAHGRARVDIAAIIATTDNDERTESTYVGATPQAFYFDFTSFSPWY